MMKRAVVLCSGGVDSATAMAIVRAEGYEVYALSFDYGQRHSVELEAARRVAESLGAARHLILKIDLRAFGGSALTEDQIAVPKREALEPQAPPQAPPHPGSPVSPVGPPAPGHSIPITYVPARNTIFLSFALAWAETLGASDIFIGVNAIDYSGYPDCRPEYIEAFQRMANLATKAGVTGANPIAIRAPLIHLTKGEIIRRGLALGVDYSLTHSCYDPAPNGFPCGHCDSCLLRAKGFHDAGLPGA